MLGLRALILLALPAAVIAAPATDSTAYNVCMSKLERFTQAAEASMIQRKTGCEYYGMPCSKGRPVAATRHLSEYDSDIQRVEHSAINKNWTQEDVPRRYEQRDTARLFASARRQADACMMIMDMEGLE